MTAPALPEGLAASFASLALAHLDREFPSKLDHVLNDAGDLRSPRELHPIFFGSFDWHSSVHAHWLLVRLLRPTPHETHNEQLHALILQTLDARFTPADIAGELAYLAQPLRAGFERTYGWAWLLKLASEITLASNDPGAAPTAREAFARWGATLAPLADAFARRFLTFLPKATYPIRAGTHPNSAFAISLALDFARAAPHPELDNLLRAAARRWFLNDADCQAWEPGGSDFLSPALIETECMRRVLPPDEFTRWLSAFLPRLHRREPAALFTPAEVSDRTDGQIVHLDGLNLSRAWCWRSLARALTPTDPRTAPALEAADLHLAASLPHIRGNYMGEHWLATFALLALTE